MSALMMLWPNGMPRPPRALHGCTSRWASRCVSCCVRVHVCMCVCVCVRACACVCACVHERMGLCVLTMRT